ncbi:MAG TPA: peptide ABC transporter substrate-binding protein [Actinomycetes bacterium]|nr:peptide ABC transporter substrate-binding protein [Actinomycetes bacterium]
MRPSKYARHLSELAIVCAISLVAAACGGGDGGGGGATQSEGKRGGSVVFAAEQWPECLNPITSCANAAWLPWTTWQYVMPRLMEIDTKGNYIASDLLVEAPTEQNGAIQQNPFRVTYKLRPEAVWDDGSQITSEDVKYTWDAIMKTTGTISTSGYEQIKSIDTPDPKTAVITFKAPYAAWGDLFGSTSLNGVILKKAAFNGKVDLAKEMQTSYPFSGGPWKLQSYSKQQTVLVRNDRYWVKDKIPLLDQVTFVPREEQSTEINSLLTGEVQAIYPQPSPGMGEQLGAPRIKVSKGAGNSYEGLWMNQSRFPFDDPRVREALAYAIDRQGVVDAIYRTDFPDLQVLNCAGWVPNVGDWCDNTAFADLTYQPDKAKSILRGAGWTLGSDGIFTKGGKKLSIEFTTTAGNKVRENTQQVMKEQAKAAGIELAINNSPPAQLFQDRLPKRDFELGEFGSVASPDPSVTSILACDQIPTPQNNYSGQNSFSWCNQEATRLMKQSDATIDHDQRRVLIQQINKLERQDLPWIPLFQKPLILAWRDDRIAGPIGQYTSSSYSGFFNIHDWYLKS